MGSFKDRSASDQVAYGYFRKVIVVLESAEDHLIIADRWFFEDGEIEFRHADDGNGGGCTRVVSAVGELRDKNFAAFGIVDRDALAVKQHWPVWWQEDDTTFQSARPFGEHIRVLSRWEIENYLLDPEALESVVANREGRALRRGESALQTVYKEYEPSVRISAAVIVGLLNGIKVKDELNKVDAQALPEKVADTLGASVERLPEIEGRIRGFGREYPEGSRLHWDRVSRLLDGKRFLKRIELCATKMKEKDDRRLELADQVRDKGRLINEIRDYLDEFKKLSLSS